MVRLAPRCLLRRCYSSSTRKPRDLIQEPRVPQSSYEPNLPLDSKESWAELQQIRANTRVLLDGLSSFGSDQQPWNTWTPRDGNQYGTPPKDITLSALMAAGAHFGHAASRLDPNFMPYAYGSRSGITIIDLDQTMSHLRRAANVVRAIAADGGQILFLGTRPDLRPIVKKAAERLHGHGFFVGDRWLPGMLSNRENLFAPHILKKYKIEPDLVVVMNPIQNVTAIHEYTLHNIPTIAVIDSNVDPRIVLYAIPANDESTRAAEVIAGVLSIAGREGVELWRARRAELGIEEEEMTDQEAREEMERSRAG